jgi:Nif-specific regulatory protein
VLAEIGRALVRAGEMRSVLERALELLEEALGIVRGAVFLFHEESGALQVDAALDISDEGLGARYRPGEGIIGRVLQSGRPVVVPASAREPLLLNRAFQRRRAGGAPEVSVLCVPIAFDRQPAGVLVVDVPFREEPRLQSRCSSWVVATMFVLRARAIGTAGQAGGEQISAPTRGALAYSGPAGHAPVYEQIAQVARLTAVLVGAVRRKNNRYRRPTAPPGHKPFIGVTACPDRDQSAPLRRVPTGRAEAAAGQR